MTSERDLIIYSRKRRDGNTLIEVAKTTNEVTSTETSVDEQLVPEQGNIAHLREEAGQQVDEAYATLQKAMNGEGDLLTAQAAHQTALDRFEAYDVDDVGRPGAGGESQSNANREITT